MSEGEATTQDAGEPEVAAVALPPGADFRGLRVHGRLGEGGMGTAWLVSHPVLRVPFVLKTFKGHAPEALLREAHLAARVVSPHVVPVLDAGVEGGVVFAVQSYVDGIDLGELLGAFERIGRRPPLAAVCWFAGDVARGLHAIHQAGVVHRDVKPANLFLRGSGEATVGDFGIALAAEAGPEPVALAGTPLFMAPELWTGEPVDRRADLYALGATAHLLATGGPPFAAPDLGAMRAAHLQRPYAPPATRAPRRAYFYQVVARLLQKAPADRYPTAEAVERVLEVIAEPAPSVSLQSADVAQVGALQIRLTEGDLARTVADVLVNAANVELTMDLGVARALRDAGGAAIEAEALRAAPAEMGDVVWTGAGDLAARHVAHAIAAMDGAMCLQRCTLRVLLSAEARRLSTVAFPALGTGVGDVPVELAAERLLQATRTFAGLAPQHVREVRFVLFGEAARARWRAILHAM